MEITKGDVARAVRKIGQHGAHFLYREVRDELKLRADDRVSTGRMRNQLRSLEDDGAIELVPGAKRKRNRYYAIKDEQKLRELVPLGISPNSAAGRNGAPADRLSRIENAIQALIERVDSFEGKINQLVSVWT